MSISKPNSGFTLIEILIAMLISTIMIGITVSQLSGARELFQAQEIQTITDDNTRFSFDLLTTEIKKAGVARASGSTEDGITGQPTSEVYPGNCSSFADTPCLLDGAGNNSDRLAIWFVADAGAEQQACNGDDITANVNNSPSIVYVFYVQQSNTGDNAEMRNSLWCDTYKVNGDLDAIQVSQSTEIIMGIQNIQFVYGIAPNGSDLDDSPVMYVDADNIDFSDTPQVRMIQIYALVGSGANDSQGMADKITYQITPSITYRPNELEYCFNNHCKVYSTAVALKNTVGGGV